MENKCTDIELYEIHHYRCLYNIIYWRLLAIIEKDKQKWKKK